MRLFFTFFIIIFFLVHCTKPEKFEGEIHLVEPEQIVHPGDDSDLSQYTLTCTDSKLIATDARSNSIYMFDYETAEHLNIIGTEGRGPGEFISAQYSFSDGKKLYISDNGNRRISIFDKNKGSFHSAIPIETPMLSRFAVSSRYIYASSPFAGDEHLFMRLHMEDGSVDYFGERPDNSAPWRNLFQMLLYRENMIAVSHTEPLIHMYDKNGELLFSYDLGNEQHLMETLEFTNQFYRNPGNHNRTVTLFNDASVFEDSLVLHVYTRPDGHIKTNHYAVYKIEENTLQRSAFFETNVGSRGITHTFCIHENRLYSNGGPDGIDIYRFDVSFLSIEE